MHAVGQLSFLPGAFLSHLVVVWFGSFCSSATPFFLCPGFHRQLAHEFPPTHLSYMDLKRICIYTCVQCGHNMSLTTLGVVWQTGSQSILDAFQVYSHLYFYIVNCYLIVISDKKMRYFIGRQSRPFQNSRIPNGNYFNDIRQYQNM